MSTRVPFEHVEKDGKWKLQDLANLASFNKDLIDYKIIHLKKEISKLYVQIKHMHKEFLDFCHKHHINDSFVILHSVTGDDVYPDGTPEQGFEAVAIEKIAIPNVSDATVQQLLRILTRKFPTLQGEIYESLDKIYRAKEHKSHLEYLLISAKQAQMDYSPNIQANVELYKIRRKNKEDLNSLQKKLIEFRSIFEIIPDVLTSETASRFHTNYIDRYSTCYVSSKKFIVKSLMKITDSFGETYEGEQDLQKFVDLFNEIKNYFLTVLPEQYVDSIIFKDGIIYYLSRYITSLSDSIVIVNNFLDVLRGTSGTGNFVIDSSVTNTMEIFDFPGNSRRLSTLTMDQVVETNRVLLDNVTKKVNDFKNMISNGASKVADNVAQTMRCAFARLSCNRVAKYRKDHDVYKEDYVREKVRRRYGGNIPFCDEVMLKDDQGSVSFVKRSEWDPDTNRKIVDVEADAALQKSGVSNNIYN